MRPIHSITFLTLALLPFAAHAAGTPAGHLDHAFGAEGKRIIGASLPSGSARGPATVLEGPNGMLYVVGFVDRADATSPIAIARLSADGAIDTAFGDDGLVEYLPPGLEAAYAYGATFDPQGRLLVVGQAAAGSAHTMLCRFDAEGGIDPDFGKPATPGCIVEAIGQQDWARAVLVQACSKPDDCPEVERILVAGAYVDPMNRRHSVIAAFRADGSSLEPTYGDQGLMKESLAPQFFRNNELNSLAQNFTGAVVAGGWVEWGPADFDFFVMRLRPEGELETGFAQAVFGGGYTAIAFDIGGANRDVATSVHLGDDEAVLIAGYAQTAANSYRPALVKLDSDGSGDQAFNGAVIDGTGKLSYDLCADPCDARFNALSVLPDGRILLAGSIARGDEGDLDVTGRNNTMAMRVLPDGTPDPAFASPDSGHDGLAVVDHGAVLGNSDDVGTSLLLQGDKLVVAGYARAVDPDLDDDRNDHYDFALIRIGAGDTVFGDGFE